MVLEDRGYDDCELCNVIELYENNRTICDTSSHSAPAVSKATKVSEILSRRATIAVLSINTSAPHSRTNNPEMNAALLNKIVSQSIDSMRRFTVPIDGHR